MPSYIAVIFASPGHPMTLVGSLLHYKMRLHPLLLRLMHMKLPFLQITMVEHCQFPIVSLILDKVSYLRTAIIYPHS